MNLNPGMLTETCPRHKYSFYPLKFELICKNKGGQTQPDNAECMIKPAFFLSKELFNDHKNQHSNPHIIATLSHRPLIFQSMSYIGSNSQSLK